MFSQDFIEFEFDMTEWGGSAQDRPSDFALGSDGDVAERVADASDVQGANVAVVFAVPFRRAAPA